MISPRILLPYFFLVAFWLIPTLFGLALRCNLNLRIPICILKSYSERQPAAAIEIRKVRMIHCHTGALLAFPFC